tara:strand:- start:10 stop:195 length:186 start_codon:yes stop_codon:yes gene_type:complete
MNSEDKKRFERYRKGYIEPNDEFNNTNTNTNTLGNINTITINKDNLITSIIDKTKTLTEKK